MKKKNIKNLPIKSFVYDGTDIVEPELLPKNGIWLRVIGLKDIRLLEKICDHYQIHDLVLEDILNPSHQLKYERFENYSLFIMKTFSYNKADNELCPSPLNIIVSKEFILTFEEKTNDIINNCVKKIGINYSSAEKTAYELLDTIIDHYLTFISSYQEIVYEIEDTILESQMEHNLNQMFNLRRELHFFRKIVHPVQDMISVFINQQNSHIRNPEMIPYLNDLYDHASRINTLVDSFWETLNSLQTEIFTQLQYKLSRTMTVMTAVSLIFMPLMVITGIYGMNFNYMPELGFKYAYPIVLAAMAFIGIGTFLLFRKRRLF
ncbi:MAG: magnesium/cobalt transporter CorA [Deferribacteraceae bacterium]|jgi:magnesium transporter|nr:magnesium/cobalt transporter CorA [Deferribacteraceae bacterium]